VVSSLNNTASQPLQLLSCLDLFRLIAIITKQGEKVS
jgi:hypothetical protein